MSDRWIKLYENILHWKWYENIYTTRLFIHLLLRANYKTQLWEGIEVERGSLVTSVKSLSLETKLSYSQVRTALEHLKLTNEIAIKSANKYTIVTICNYGIYQVSDKSKSQTKSQTKSQSNRNNNRNIEYIEKENNNIVDFEDPIETLFDSLWKLYPRKEGKSSVSRIHKEEIYRIGYDRMAKAIEKYKSTVEGRDPKYVKMGSSFFNTNYVDYLEEDVTEQKVDPAPEEDEEEEMSDEDWLKMMRERYGE